MKYRNKNRIKKDPPIKTSKLEPRKTTIAGGTFKDKINAHLDLHAHALFSSLGRLLAAPYNSTITIAVLAIAISLAGGFYILVSNFQQLTANLENSNQISLFLRQDVSEAHAKKLADSIRLNREVQSVKLITKEQGLTEFKSYSGFGEAINHLETNPLPIVLEVLPKNTLDDKESLNALLKRFEQSPDVDFAQLDLQWVERLQAIVAVVRLFANLLSVLLGAAVLFVIGNTVRLELHQRREEVVISKLVGATNAFIQRPFLYTGFWIGFFSGVLAWFIVAIFMLILNHSVETLSRLYGSTFHLLFLSFTESFTLIGMSSLLGILGSWLVLICFIYGKKTR